jgi:acetyl-CoA carboxylase biotin carboxyl carrier protein
MNLDDIKQILDLVREHDLSDFELERDGLKLRVRKVRGEAAVPVNATPAGPAPAAPSPAAATGTPSPAPAPPAAGLVDELPGTELAVVTSPIVGTFYRSSEPDARPFVEVGDAVAKNQVLCIIEAMKLMNEIESDVEGEIAAIYVENGKPVQFGDRLFAIKVT